MQRAIAVTGLALGFIAQVALAGCAADEGTDGGMIVLKSVAPGANCTSMVDEKEIGLSRGSIDTLLPSSYLMIAQVKSRIIALEGQEDQRTIFTSGARVDITFPDSTFFTADELTQLQDQGLTKYRTLFTAAVAPNGGLTDVGFFLVPAGLLARMNQKSAAPFRLEMIATFTIEGDMSGTAVESNAYHYPMTVGRGVTINVAGTCPLPSSFMVRSGSSCNPTQDGVVDCCTDARAVSADNPEGLICPAPTEVTGGGV
jgi:hypothetical protein